MNILEVKNLKVYFESDRTITEAVKGIDFGIGQDEIVGLAGRSGCGKTVTALSIIRLIPREAQVKEGEIIFQGRDLFKLSEAEMRRVRGRLISMVFQEPFTSLNPIMRIGEQIQEVIRVHQELDVRASKKRALELLDRVRIAAGLKVFYDYPHQLSGGQRQRVMIAIALAFNPKFLICDEPTTALDVTTQSEILKLILELKKEFKMSVLFITHDLGIVQDVAGRLLVMEQGEIVEQGLVEEVLRKPACSYTAELLEAALKKSIEISYKPQQEERVIIEARDVSKSFSIERGLTKRKVDSISAVKSVNLKLERGRTLGLVGESGSGKTTLARMLIGLIKPDRGEILLKGMPIGQALKDKPKSVRKMMQIVFQDPYNSLDPRMRMKDIVLEGRRALVLGRADENKIFKRFLEMVALKYQDRLKYPHQFSGGQKQRIALARALAVGAEVLILDEPVSSLDVSTQMEILKLLVRLQKKLGLTYLLVAHDLSIVKCMCHDVFVMYKGEVVEASATGELFRNPQASYTRVLLKSMPRLKR
ncbi:MAG: ABC transporter ATP-binding protein [Candidatus Omnitrophota bacterium]|nr:ABC transporter ATP-binding protein [Candidatus Omnitrophota bacterium]